MMGSAEGHVETTVWELLRPDPTAVSALVTALNVDELVARLLVNRGLTEADAARRFLSPRLSEMPDPFLMKGMGQAVDRILVALDDDQQICVWGDYDVDGVTSASQLIWFFRALGRELRYFVPDRFTDGYGLHGDRVEALADDGVELLITVDCGVSSVAEVARANAKGMDVIVVDHHQVPEVLPAAHTILNPVQPDCPYPEKGLAACGVVFVLLVALRKTLRERGAFAERTEPDLREWLDLTAIGTIADVVPLKGLNRVITRHGLARLAQTERPGLKALCQVANFRPDQVNAWKVGFQLGPRINAAGRIAHASAGVELLTTEDHTSAVTTAEAIDTYNTDRRVIQDTIQLEAEAMAEDHPDPAGRRTIVLAREGWHPGVLGIVASRLKERYQRPTILMAIEDGVAKGSARSIPGFRLVQHLRKVEDLLTNYGGHAYAAGLTLPVAELDTFKARFEGLAAEVLTADHLRRHLRVDVEVALTDVSTDMLDTLRTLAPYGKGNPEPLLMARNVTVRQSRIIGKDRSHLKMQLEAGLWSLDAIAFGMAAQAPSPGDRVDILFRPDLNEFRGTTTLQLQVKALRPASGDETSPG